MFHLCQILWVVEFVWHDDSQPVHFRFSVSIRISPLYRFLSWFIWLYGTKRIISRTSKFVIKFLSASLLRYCIYRFSTFIDNLNVKNNQFSGFSINALQNISIVFSIDFWNITKPALRSLLNRFLVSHAVFGIDKRYLLSFEF